MSKLRQKLLKEERRDKIINLALGKIEGHPDFKLEVTKNSLKLRFRGFGKLTSLSKISALYEDIKGDFEAYMTAEFDAEESFPIIYLIEKK